uniref:Uncharacterized protein n=1 Tax=Pinctada fucata TaxID=50426 RepID=A0A194AMN2_PINFU
MLKAHVFIPLVACFLQWSFWSCSCSSTTDNPAIVAPSSENETSDSSPERIPTPTTSTTGYEQSPTEPPAAYTTFEPVKDDYKVTITKMLNIHQTDATTERGKSTAQDSTERITNGFAGDTIGISRETTDIITAVVVIYTALVVTLVALRMCSSRVLKKQEMNSKDKSDTFKSKTKGEIDLEEVKCQDETRQTNEIKDDREDDKNAAAVVADVVHDTILNDFDEEQKVKSSDTDPSMDGGDTNVEAKKQNCSPNNEFNLSSASEKGLNSDENDTIENNLSEENEDQRNFIYKPANEREVNELIDCSVPNETEKAADALQGENENQNETFEGPFADDTFPPPPTPTTEVSGMFSQAGIGAPVDTLVVSVLATAMLTNNLETPERDEVLAVESTHL